MKTILKTSFLTLIFTLVLSCKNNQNSSTDPEDPIRKLDETEKTVFDYVDNYLLESSLIAKDVERSVQLILDEFAKSKIKYIQ